MKFGNGCWLQKEGIECFPPQEVYFVDKTEKEVKICAPTHHIMHRGDTLGGDRTLTYWRNVHEKFFTECFMEIGLKFYTDTQVVCEEFEVVYRI